MKVVITGSSSGIGRSVTESLLCRGDEVWGVARSDQSDLKSNYKGLFNYSLADVSSWEEIKKVATAISESWTSIDALITCAGIQGEVGRTVNTDPEKWAKTVTANLSGTYYSIRAFHPLLCLNQKRGKIICFSGGGATKARPNFSAYGASKTAIVRLVETIAEEEKSSNFDINSVAPGSINTRLTDEVLHLGPSIVGETEYNAALKQKNEGGQSLKKVIELIEWLLSNQSDGLSGKLLSAQWDPWNKPKFNTTALNKSEVYTLRRILPEDRNLANI